jgi:hypothetical protein
MKIVKTPAVPEKALVVSDFSGKKFESSTPEVHINLQFNYGSKYDGARLSLDLFDEEFAPLLDVIFEKLHKNAKTNIKKSLHAAQNEYEKCVDARDWSSCDLFAGQCQLYQSALKSHPLPRAIKKRPPAKRKAPKGKA